MVLPALVLAACLADHIVSLELGEQNRRVEASVGDRIEITLRTIGPGEYANPPAISAPAVVFVDVAFVGPSVPGGPTQRFRFRAASRGMAVITFTNTGVGPTVTDTVVIR
jgi:hypothetical protein